MSFLKNMFTDYKPMIVDAINNAKHEEHERLIKMIDNIVQQIKDGKIKKEDVDMYWFYDKFKQEHSKKEFNVKGASARDMYQALLLITPNVKYESIKNYHVAKTEINGCFIHLTKYDDLNCIFVNVDTIGFELYESILFNKL